MSVGMLADTAPIRLRFNQNVRAAAAMNQQRLRLVAALSISGLAACSTPPIPPNITNPGGIALSRVIDQLSYELSVYATEARNNPIIVSRNCGGAQTLNVLVNNVEIDLFTSVARRTDNSLNFTVPLANTPIVPGGGVSAGGENTNSQTLRVNISPSRFARIDRQQGEKLNLADALLALRREIGMIGSSAGAAAGACIQFNATATRSHALTFAFRAVERIGGGLGVSILFVDVKNTNQREESRSNTLTITLRIEGSRTGSSEPLQRGPS